MKLTMGYKSPPAVLHNKEVGKRVFILANGPSVNKEDLSLLRDEVVIGMNASTVLEERFQFETDYYVLSDARFLSSDTKRPWATSKLSPNTHRVIRSDIRSFDDAFISNRTTWVRPLERDGFSKNLDAGFYYGSTTTLLALQLAWHLGSREVYLMGCDLKYPEDNPRFYAEETPQIEDAFASVQLLNIINAAKIFESDGGQLVNCSEISFARPYLDYQEFATLFSTREVRRDSLYEVGMPAKIFHQSH